MILQEVVLFVLSKYQISWVYLEVQQIIAVGPIVF